TVMARMPSGIVAGNPAPDSFGASLLSRTGSFSASGVIRARFAQSSMRVNIPATGLFEGQEITRRLLASNRAPNCKEVEATTRGCVATVCALVEACLNWRYT